MATKDQLDKVIYSYTAQSNALDEENKLLKQTINQLRSELDKFRQPPLMICEVKDFKEDKVIIRTPNGNQFLVNMASNCKKPSIGHSVVVEQKNLTIVESLTKSKSFDVEKFVIIDKPKMGWDVVGGLNEQINEIREVVELPLKKPHLFKNVGIQPPKGILLYGPPGTGKTLLAKAVAASTKSTFIEIVGSELVQKFIGEGARLVKEVFELAREKAPAIVFIDEIDALAAKRIEIGTSGEREVQRTFMQLLAELDGFKPLGNVKIIGATNRKDILDPAVVRPGRLDRLIHVPYPTFESKIEILKIHTRKMKLAKSVDLNKISKLMPENFSGAEIKATCTEAGYFAIRRNKRMVRADDFKRAIQKVKRHEELEGKDYLNMFG